MGGPVEDPTASDVGVMARLDRGLRWSLPGRWVVYPLGYLAYVAVMGVISLGLAFDASVLGLAPGHGWLWWGLVGWGSLLLGTPVHEACHQVVHRWASRGGPVWVVLGAQPRTMGPDLSAGWSMAKAAAGPLGALALGLTMALLGPVPAVRFGGIAIIVVAGFNLLPIGTNDGRQVLEAWQQRRRGH